jgi:hypothetical protein
MLNIGRWISDLDLTGCKGVAFGRDVSVFLKRFARMPHPYQFLGRWTLNLGLFCPSSIVE